MISELLLRITEDNEACHSIRAAHRHGARDRQGLNIRLIMHCFSRT